MDRKPLRHARTHATFFSVVVLTATYFFAGRQDSGFAMALTAAIGSSLWLVGLAIIGGVWRSATKIASASLLSLGGMAIGVSLFPEYGRLFAVATWGFAGVCAIGAIVFSGALFHHVDRGSPK